MRERFERKREKCVFMKTHQELLNNYHEACWALAMERVAARQGEAAKALEERLDGDPAAAVPASTVEHCKMTIRRAFRPRRAKRAGALLSKVLIAALLCALMTSAACAISPDFRAFLARVFYSVAETFTALTLRDPQVEDVGEIQGQTEHIYNGLRFEWLPEGYEYIDGSENPKTQRVEFENSRTAYLRVRVTDYDDSFVYNYDSEASTVTTVSIGSFSGQLIKEDNQYSIFWVDEQRNKTISILATDLPQEELLQFAQGIKY